MNKTLLVLALVSAVGAAHANFVILADDFEGKAVGSNNVGQNFPVDNTAVPGPWQLVGTSIGTTISNAQASGGTQSLFIDRLHATNASWTFGDLNGGSALAFDPAVTAVTASSDFMFAPGGGSNSGAIGLDLYGTGGRYARILARGDGAVLFSAPTTSGALATFVSTFTVSSSAWFNLQVIQTYVNATSSVFSFAVNGVNLTSGTSTVAYTLNNAGGVGLTDADLHMTTFSGTFPTLAADYYADNYRVEAVPEPASMAALGLGLVAIIRRRRNRS